MPVRTKPSSITYQKRAYKSNQLIRYRYGVRLVHHRHSWRFLPWHYTSYAILYFLLLLTAFLILFASNAVKAGPPQTAQGSIAVSGVVNGPPPSTPAVITSPKNNARVSDGLIPVNGTCTQNLFVELYRNNTFAGQDLCDVNNSFEIMLTLVPGENKLMVKVKDGANQYGPDSSTVIVFYDTQSSSQNAPGGSGSRYIANGNLPQFLLYTDSVLHGTVVNKKFTLVYEIDGGNPPYAVSIDWGDDSKDSVYSHNAKGDYIAEHKYQLAGQFTISIGGSDSMQTKAIIQTIVVVHGTETAALIASDACQPVTKCLASSSFVLDMVNRYIWPAMLIAFLMTFSFWLGERVVYTGNRHKPKHA